MMYKNPIPVVVGIVLVEADKVLIVKRAIEPFINEWALPGGYLEEGDDWRERLRCEIEEEACIVVSKDHMRLYDARTTPDGKKLLLFAEISRDGVEEVRDFVPNNEVSERRVATLDLYSRPKLCFDLHEEVLDQHREQYWNMDRQHIGGW